MKLCRQTPLMSDIGSLDAAVDIAAMLLNPVLKGSVHGLRWDSAVGEWA